jgi:hypothetical protein
VTTKSDKEEKAVDSHLKPAKEQGNRKKAWSTGHGAGNRKHGALIKTYICW